MILSGFTHPLNLAGQSAPSVGDTVKECMITILERQPIFRFFRIGPKSY